MGLFDLLEDVVKLPLNVAVDVVKAPVKLVTQKPEELGEHTIKKVKDIVEEITE